MENVAYTMNEFDGLALMQMFLRRLHLFVFFFVVFKNYSMQIKQWIERAKLKLVALSLTLYHVATKNGHIHIKHNQTMQ